MSKSKQISFNLTTAGIERAIADPDITAVKDKKTPLLLRLNKTCNTWFFEKSRKSKMERHCLGDYKNLPLPFMRSKLPDLMLKFAKGEKLVISQFATVAALLDWFIAREKANTITSDKFTNSVSSIVKAQLSPRLGHHDVLQLNKTQIDTDLIQAMLAEDYAASTIKQVFSKLKRAYDQAFNVDLIESNPLQSMRFKNFITSKIKAKPGALTPGKLSHVIGQLKTSVSPVYLYVLFVLGYGTRKTETALMRWDWIELNSNEPCIVIPESVTKTDDPLTLPLTDFMLEAIAEHQSYQRKKGYQGPYMFPSDNKKGPISEYKAHDWIKSVSEHQWTAHDLRKLCCDSWLEDGVDYLVIQRLLNHALDKVDQAYIHTHVESGKRKAITAWHTKLKKFISENHSLTIQTQPDLSKWRKSA